MEGTIESEKKTRCSQRSTLEWEWREKKPERPYSARFPAQIKFTNNYYFEKKLQTARVKDIDAVCSGNKFKLDMLFFSCDIQRLTDH